MRRYRPGLIIRKAPCREAAGLALSGEVKAYHQQMRTAGAEWKEQVSKTRHKGVKIDRGRRVELRRGEEAVLVVGPAAAK